MAVNKLYVEQNKKLETDKLQKYSKFLKKEFEPIKHRVDKPETTAGKIAISYKDEIEAIDYILEKRGMTNG